LCGKSDLYAKRNKTLDEFVEAAGYNRKYALHIPIRRPLAGSSFLR
jgi:hypothetical protein